LQRVPRELLDGPAPDIAPRLLGLLVVRDDERGRRIGRIVETEAYAGPSDRASHSRVGRTPRTAPMFGPPGHAYVYLVYGVHHCLNVVCGPDGTAAAVLIRALEPVAGLSLMREVRGRPAVHDARLAGGPGLVCAALGIDRAMSGLDLVTDDGLWLAMDDGSSTHRPVRRGPRVGVAYAGEPWVSRPWRFGLADSRSLSRAFPLDS
jgi:DNA-3-methyladenine glycosylase